MSEFSELIREHDETREEQQEVSSYADWLRPGEKDPNKKDGRFFDCVDDDYIVVHPFLTLANFLESKRAVNLDSQDVAHLLRFMHENLKLPEG